MSYRLITKASLVITPIAGEPIGGEVTLRAYTAPKSPAKGQIDVDGNATDYRRTGGKGRGLISHTYLYVNYKSESAFFEITDAQAAALSAGGKATLVTLTAEAPAAEAPKAAEEPKAEQPAAPAKKAPRRAKATAAA